MRETLPLALKLMFGDEGGYSNVKTDAGGPTKYGITIRTLSAWRRRDDLTAEDVKELTLAEAEKIYRANYWTQSGGDLLPRGLDYAAFDFGVNSGPTTAVRTLQKLLGVRQDGSVGVQTLDAIGLYGKLETLIVDYCAARMAYLRGLKGKQGFPANGRGWTIRVTGKDPKGQWAAKPGVIGHAIELARTAAGGEPAIEPIAAPAPRTSEDRATIDAMAAKAPPQAPSATTSPEILATGSTAFVGVLTALSGLQGPLAYAAAGVIVVAACVAAFYIVRRIRSQPA